jgi:hypothetical protein
VDLVSVWQPAINNGLGSASVNMAAYSGSGFAMGELFGALMILGFLLFSVVVLVSFFYFALKKTISI